MTQYTKPLPTPDDFDKPYWTALKKHELRMQKCVDCGEIWFPPTPVCPACLSHNHEWIKLSGKGKIWSWVFFHQLYFPSFSDEIPYNVVAVKLDEGPLMTSNMVECKNEDIRCDMRVEVFFDDVTDLVTLPKFRPDGSAKPGS
ncbi:MAG: Zn-ribbon domain-containing OB-fold protein [Syntrophobacterales bacterium]|nr:Zn-ribbon domain-containing OB-fold protein [Syntrophobacterales bacterium]